jgi:alkaline phosphatase D
MADDLDRREFLKQAGNTALGAAALNLLPATVCAGADIPAAFHSGWPDDAERPWPGPEYWSNPLQDWQVRSGRLECIGAGADRNVALLTRVVAARPGDLMLAVRIGRLDSIPLKEGFVGFRVGIKHAMDDYRAAAIYGQGMKAGIDAAGNLFVGEVGQAAPRVDLSLEIELQMAARPSATGYTVTLSANSATLTAQVPADSLTGGLALVCSSGPVGSTPVPLASIKDFNFYPPHQQSQGNMRFWFKDWTVAGSKVDVHEERAFGPILFALYTQSRGTIKISAQFAPLGNAAKTVILQLPDASGQWQTEATSELDPDAWNAVFRLSKWNAQRETPYRILYTMPQGTPRQYTYEGKIRQEPIARPEVTIGLLTCIWDFGFPHQDFTTNLATHQPDILFWTGDQIYEPVGGFGAIRSRDPALLEAAMLDFLRKWYIFGWAVGNLTREIPSVCMTDDHDMFHGNIWGCGGRPTNPAATSTYDQQDSGGYKMSPRWVNMVQRVQTSHLPDPFDPTPVEQGINVYYTHLTYGGLSFAILEDRKWKSAPREHLPEARIVNGFALNPDWQASTQSNVEDAELLGQRQLDFLEYWAADWSGGAWMKFAVSQTLFGCLHTEPAGDYTDDEDPREAIPPLGAYIENDHVVADHDSGGWPQRGRNSAILKWRKGFAAHLCGDQHLGTAAHYGVNEFRDGVYSVCTPAISNIFPRRWFPPDSASRNTGDYHDGFGNHMTVLAVANPAQHPGPGLEGLRYRVTGYTILKCNRATRKTTIAAWPRWVDPSAPGARPYEGWPVTMDQLDNGLCKASWELDRIESTGLQDPVVQVQNAATREVLYTLRVNGDSFTPLVREPGTYTVLAYDPDGGYFRSWAGLKARQRQPA